jgi:MarR family transcriptional regulator, transcriptional regulator for hemolysin
MHLSAPHDLFHTIQQLSRKMTNRLNETLHPFGLYSAQWAVLYTLYTKDSMTQKDLTLYLSVEAPPMTRTIQRLVKQGYVQQVQGRDKREKYILLTEVALKEFPIWEEAVSRNNQELIEKLPVHSQQQLYPLLKEWVEKLS